MDSCSYVRKNTLLAAKGGCICTPLTPLNPPLHLHWHNTGRVDCSCTCLVVWYMTYGTCEHWIITPPSSGSLHLQNTGINSVSVLLTLALRREDLWGKVVVFPAVIHDRRWSHICGWSYRMIAGSWPSHIDVANASTSNPQSLPPLCHSTLA